MHQLTRFVLGSLALLAGFMIVSAADNLLGTPPSFTGKFQNDKVSIELALGRNGSYTGQMHLGPNAFPLEARLAGDALQGTFQSQGHPFPFTATLRGDVLNLASGGVTHALRREPVAPANPLATPGAAAPENPLANAPVRPAHTNAAASREAGAEPGTLEGYDVLASAGDGRTLFTNKPGIASAKEGALAALRNLKKLFDDKPAIAGAFGDANDKQCQASFTTKLKGADVKGSVLCGVGENGAAISVVFARADAPVAELAKLMGALPAQKKWTVHPLPGGSGTIELPDDWKITMSTQLGSVAADGPAEQKIGLGIGAEVVDPKSFIAAQVRAAGTMLVAPFSDPVTAVKNLVPQLSAMSQRKGGPAIMLNRIITNAPAPAQLPGGQAAWITSSVTRGTGPSSIQVREVALLECYPVGPLAWGIYTSYSSAPESTFDRDFPIMMQIAKSWKLNDQAVISNSRQMIDAQNRSFAAFQQSMKERNAAFDDYMASVRNSERVRERSNADFIEVIRGYRTVEDTQTGNRKDVDLGYSKEIVDKLNEHEGYSRYKEIPLRDQ